LKHNAFLAKFAVEVYEMTAKAIDINSTLIDGYLRLLGNLSPSNKLDLISRLTLSVKTDIADNGNSFYKAFGAWESKQTADEMISDIRASRTFNRQTEQL
jgi:hypothetical protein